VRSLENAYVGVEDTVRCAYGCANQSAGIGYCELEGLNALSACVSTPLTPRDHRVLAVAGAVGSARGSTSFVAEVLRTGWAAPLFGPLALHLGSDAWNLPDACLNFRQRIARANP
jgi:hypothetical protein